MEKRDAGESREKAIEILRNSNNWILISESINISEKRGEVEVGQIGIAVATHLWGIDEKEMHSFLISVRKAEDTLLDALRRSSGMVVETREAKDGKMEVRGE